MLHTGAAVVSGVLETGVMHIAAFFGGGI